MSSKVVAVCSNPRHGFSKQPQLAIHLLAGQGVQGDAHCGATVQHVYLRRKNPLAPNRMQVHLIQSELFDDLAAAGYQLRPGDLGENITTRNLDLLSLPCDTLLHIGEEAVVQLTGLRTPCKQIDTFRAGLLKQVTVRDQANTLAKAGVMAVVLCGGLVTHDAGIVVELPRGPHASLALI